MLHGSTHERTAISSDKHGKDNRDRGADKDGKLLQSLIQPLREGSAYWGAPAAHSAPRTWSARPSLPSRPGEFHPESLTDPDVILSHHPARAIARRLPPSAEIAGSSRFDPVGPRSTTMTHPLRSMGIAPLRRYYEAVRPSPAHRYFQPHGWSRLCFFPWHRRPGSHVPYRSLV